MPAIPGVPAELRIGIALPAGYVAAGTLVPDVEAALRSSGLAPEQLVLRMDGGTLAAARDRAALDVAALRFLGVRVALAGFGSGSSVLADLTRLPLDIVTLDRALISRIDRDPQSRALCESIIGIAHALALEVVAEGVETPAQLGVLSASGCDCVQGFTIGRPLPLSALSELWVGDRGHSSPGLASSR